MQGVAVARSAFKDRGQPGTVFKYHEGKWDQPGMGGKATPIFHAAKSWKGRELDAFWGPSVHWNTHLRMYVMLLNRAIDHGWVQEGIYICFSGDLLEWTPPKRIVEGGPWYPSIIGETDTLAGAEARYFQRGVSRHVIRFKR